jgi:hypothetical protein
MSTAALSAVTTASGTAVLIIFVLWLIVAEARRQRLRPPGRLGVAVTAALTLLLGADVLTRFVVLAHGY